MKGMEGECQYIFVYGTLRDSSVNHKAHFLKEHGIYVGAASIYAKLYKVSWYPAIVLEEGKSSVVHGEIYKLPIASCEMILHELDGYEGIYSTNEESDEYERVITKATKPKGESLSCWVYNYKASIEHAEEITSGDYIAYLRGIETR